MKLLFDKTDTLIFEDDKFFVKNTCVATENDEIKYIGDIPKDFIPDKVLGGDDFLLMPGLINSHTHAYMSIFRNYADDLPFNEWLFEKIEPVENKLTKQDAYYTTLLANIEMMKTGTTTFCDMHMFEGSICEAVIASQMRAVLCRGLSGGDDAGGHRRLREARSDIMSFSGIENITFMIAPHAIYSCDDKLLMLAAEEAQRHNIGLNIHLSETEYEVSECYSKHNASPVKYLDDLNFFDTKTLAAHCVHVSDEDIDILKERNVCAIHNPISNLKLANGIAPVPKMLAKDINVALGTDGSASNNALNMIREMSFASLIHKGITKDPEAVNANEVLKMATVNGAKALNINAGEIAVGKKADLVLLNTDKPQFYPKNNMVASLSYSAMGSEVDTVIINGNITVESGKVITLDEENIYYEINKIKDKYGF